MTRFGVSVENWSRKVNTQVSIAHEVVAHEVGLPFLGGGAFLQEFFVATRDLTFLDQNFTLSSKFASFFTYDVWFRR